VTEYRVLAIGPEPAGGVGLVLQMGLNEAAKEGFELKALVPFQEGLLVVFAREGRKPESPKS
jgi:hypothetical protein